jgi:hypothetical protein
MMVELIRIRYNRNPMLLGPILLTDLILDGLWVLFVSSAARLCSSQFFKFSFIPGRIFDIYTYACQIALITVTNALLEVPANLCR